MHNNAYIFTLMLKIQTLILMPTHQMFLCTELSRPVPKTFRSIFFFNILVYIPLNLHRINLFYFLLKTDSSLMEYPLTTVSQPSIAPSFSSPPFSLRATLPQFPLQRRAGLQEMAVKQDKTRHSKIKLNPLY